MREYIPKLIPRIVEALLDEAAATKCEVVVATPGQLVQSTGYVSNFINITSDTIFRRANTFYKNWLVFVYSYVIAPCNEYPQLSSLLLKLLNGELAWSTRREVLKVCF